MRGTPSLQEGSGKTQGPEGESRVNKAARGSVSLVVKVGDKGFRAKLPP